MLIYTVMAWLPYQDASSCFIYYYFLTKIRLLSRQPPPIESIRVISTNIEAEEAAQEIFQLTREIPFLGLDCEWVGQNPTALLQLSLFNPKTNASETFLFRLSDLDKNGPLGLVL